MSESGWVSPRGGSCERRGGALVPLAPSRALSLARSLGCVCSSLAAPFLAHASVDYVHTSGGRTTAHSKRIRAQEAGNTLTWSALHRLSKNRGIIADTGYGVGGKLVNEPLLEAAWLSASRLRERIADGVVAVTFANPSKEWEVKLGKLRATLPHARHCFAGGAAGGSHHKRHPQTNSTLRIATVERGPSRRGVRSGSSSNAGSSGSAGRGSSSNRGKSRSSNRSRSSGSAGRGSAETTGDNTHGSNGGSRGGSSFADLLFGGLGALKRAAAPIGIAGYADEAI